MSTLSEAYRDHPQHLHHIIPLEFDSAQAVPESHVWPQSDELAFKVQPNEQLSIPIIDFMDPNAAKLVGHACETWGTFQLTNHGLPISILKDVESEAHRFFSLPAQQKMKALRSPGGASGYGIARMSPFFNKLMWHEGFTIVDSSADHAKELWPHDYQNFW